MKDHAQLEDKARQQNRREPLPEGTLAETHIIDDFTEDELKLSHISLFLQLSTDRNRFIFVDTVLEIVELFLDQEVVFILLLLLSFVDQVVAEARVIARIA